MTKFYKKVIFIVLILSLLIPTVFISAQGKELEVEYPEIGGLEPETTEFPIGNYFKYILNFVLIFAGLLALGVLIWAGVRYLTSTGDPEAQGAAKKRIKAAFWGILLLFSSYLILITISPQLISFQPGELPEISLGPPQTAGSSFVRKDLLGRIKEMAEAVQQVSNETESTAKNIKKLTSECNCKYTDSICYCAGGDATGYCQSPQTPQTQCSSNPCPNFKKIKSGQVDLATWKEELVYYKNRTLNEIDDLEIDLNQILAEKISWYTARATLETDQRFVDALKETRDWYMTERNYKSEIKSNLNRLMDRISEIEIPLTELSQLPDQCLTNGPCTANCVGECHNDLWGCKSEKCGGGNPCPVQDIDARFGKIRSLSGEINSISAKIIDIINNIEEEREKQHNL